MNRHRYLLAYMSGVLLPTWFMLIVLAAFIIGRLAYHIPIPVERGIAFPMALVPNLWGVWNVLYLALGLERRMALGAWGAVLPLILIPSGMALARSLGFAILSPLQAVIAAPLVAGFYYLVWKHVVTFFNRVAGVD